METKTRRYRIRLNSVAKVEELLQEAYNQACQQVEAVQNEMNKLSQSTILSQEITDAKVKYAKAMNDFIVSKDKAIGRKIEIAKFMGEVIKHNGNLKNAVDETGSGLSAAGLNFDEIKAMLAKAETETEKQIYKV